MLGPNRRLRQNRIKIDNPSVIRRLCRDP